MKYLGVILVSLAVLLLLPSKILAENSVSTSESESITGTQNAQEAKELMNENKKKFKEQAEEQKKRIEAEKEEYKKKVEELRNKISTQKEEYKNELEKKREDFKLKLEEFKNQKKKLAAERVDENLEKINDKRTEQMTRSLEKLSEILDKYSSRTATLKENNIDTTAIETAIQKAKDAISNASSKISEQSEKEYVAQVVDEATAGKVISEASQELRNDLKALTAIVKEAKLSVREAVSVYAKTKSAAKDSI